MKLREFKSKFSPSVLSEDMSDVARVLREIEKQGGAATAPVIANRLRFERDGTGLDRVMGVLHQLYSDGVVKPVEKRAYAGKPVYKWQIVEKETDK